MLPRIRPAEETGRFNMLHEVFQAQVDRRSEAVALIIEGKTITYGELEQRANRLAHYLRRRGVRRGSLVAILLPRSLDAYVAILGTIKSGAAYLPLDPEYPADRVRYVLRDSQAEALITTGNLASQHITFEGRI